MNIRILSALLGLGMMAGLGACSYKPDPSTVPVNQPGSTGRGMSPGQEAKTQNTQTNR